MRKSFSYLVLTSLLALSSIHVSAVQEGVACGESLEEDARLEASLQCMGEGLEIVESGVTLDCGGNTITGLEDRGSGILAENVTDVTVRDCRVNGFYSGVKFRNVNDSLITGSEAFDNYGTGVSLIGSHNNSLRGNVVERNWDGIFLENSTENLIVDNEAHENSIDGVHLFYGSYRNTVRNNDLTGNYGHGLAPAVCGNDISGNTAGTGAPIRYVQDAEDVKVADTSRYSEIIFCNVSESLIENVSIVNGNRTSDGILMVNSDRNVVTGSYFEDVRSAIYLFRGSDRNRITQNYVNGSDIALRLRLQSSGNILRGNTVVDADSYAKAVRNSSDNLFQINNLSGYSLNFRNSEVFNVTAPQDSDMTQGYRPEVSGSTIFSVLSSILLLAALWSFIRLSDSFDVF